MSRSATDGAREQQSVLLLKISAGQIKCSGSQVSRPHRRLTPQFTCGCSDVATKSRSAQLREHFRFENALFAVRGGYSPVLFLQISGVRP